MSEKTERIQYLTRKAQRSAINSNEKKELARLLNKNPKEFNDEEGTSALVGLALVVIALALLSEIFSDKEKKSH